MSRFIKRLLIILAAFSILSITVALVLPFVVDVNDYKQEIADQVRDVTGRELRIQGDIKPSLIPWVGVEINDVSLANAEGFAPADMVSIGKASIRLKLWPLISQRIVLDTIILDDMALNLGRDDSGHSNWQDLTAPAADPNAEAATVTAPTTTANPLAVLGVLTLGGIAIRDARIHWQDRQAGDDIRIDGFQMHSGAIVPGKPVRLDMAMHVASKQLQAEMALSLQTDVTIDVDQQQLHLRAFRLQTNAESTPRSLSAAMTVSGELDYALPSQRLQVGALQIDGHLQGPDIPGGQVPFMLSSRLDLDWRQQTARIDAMQLTVHNLTLSGKSQISHLLASPQYRGELGIADFDPRQLLKKLALAVPPTADGNALSALSVKLQYQGDAERLALSDIAIQLDQSHLDGKLSVENFSKPAVRYRLALDAIDVDRYLPPVEMGSGTPVASPAAAGAAAANRLPLAMLRELDIDGLLTIDRLTVQKLRLARLRLATRADAGLISLKPIRADLYGGQYQGGVQLDVRGDTPVISANEHLRGIDLEPLLRDYTGKDLAYGRGTINVRLTARGQQPAAMLASLDGDVDIDFRNGGLRGVALVDMLQRSDYFKDRQLPPGVDKDQTVFSRFSASATIKQGLLQTDDIVLESAQLLASGRGQVNLPRQTLDLRIDATTRRELAKLLGDLGGQAIPVIVAGSLAAPTYRVDLQGLLQARLAREREKVKQRLQQEKKKQLQKARAAAKKKLDAEKKRLQEQLKNKLKSLF